MFRNFFQLSSCNYLNSVQSQDFILIIKKLKPLLNFNSVHLLFNTPWQLETCINGPWTQQLQLWCWEICPVSLPSSTWKRLALQDSQVSELRFDDLKRTETHRSTSATGASPLKRLWQVHSCSRWGLTLTSASSFSFYASVCQRGNTTTIRKPLYTNPNVQMTEKKMF